MGQNFEFNPYYPPKGVPTHSLYIFQPAPPPSSDIRYRYIFIIDCLESGNVMEHHNVFLQVWCCVFVLLQGVMRCPSISSSGLISQR